jgi:curved DNA-binding protein
MADYYYILGVTKNAKLEDIKRSYRKLAMEHHPDKNPGNATSEIKFRQIAEAYEILSDASKRREYDLGGISDAFKFTNTSGMNFSNPTDIFKDFFGKNDIDEILKAMHINITKLRTPSRMVVSNMPQVQSSNTCIQIINGQVITKKRSVTPGGSIHESTTSSGAKQGAPFHIQMR